MLQQVKVDPRMLPTLQDGWKAEVVGGGRAQTHARVLQGECWSFFLLELDVDIYKRTTHNRFQAKLT